MNGLNKLKRNNMKQTAVEWLIQKINHTGWGNIMIDIPKEFIEQAKAMEKEQIIKFANDYLDDDADLTAEQYYKETYGQNRD